MAKVHVTVSPTNCPTAQVTDAPDGNSTLQSVLEMERTDDTVSCCNLSTSEMLRHDTVSGGIFIPLADFLKAPRCCTGQEKQRGLQGRILGDELTPGNVCIYQPYHQICADRPSWCKTNFTVTTLLRFVKTVGTCMHIFWTVQKFSLTCGLIDSLFTRYAAVKWQLYHHASQKKVLHAQVAAFDK